MTKRDDGFAWMDVATDIHSDAKFRRLARAYPGLFASAFTAYVALLAESWRAAARVTLEDAWPALLPYEQAVPAALLAVGLIDGDGRVPEHAWNDRFIPAYERRDKQRAKWRNDAAHRHSATESAAESATDPLGIPRLQTGQTGQTGQDVKIPPRSPTSTSTSSSRAGSSSARRTERDDLLAADWEAKNTPPHKGTTSDRNTGCPSPRPEPEVMSETDGRLAVPLVPGEWADPPPAPRGTPERKDATR